MDVIGINRFGSNAKTDVYLLNGASGFQNFLLQVNTDMPTGTANYAYLVDDGTRATGLGYAGAPPILKNETTTGIQDKIVEVNNVLVYPNPAKDEVMINLGDYAGKALELTITPVGGGTLSVSRTYKSTDLLLTLPLADLPPGIYILQLNFQGSNLIQKKLVITK